jgi:hypothetical protein
MPPVLTISNAKLSKSIVCNCKHSLRNPQAPKTTRHNTSLMQQWIANPNLRSCDHAAAMESISLGTSKVVRVDSMMFIIPGADVIHAQEESGPGSFSCCTRWESRMHFGRLLRLRELESRMRTAFV